MPARLVQQHDLSAAAFNAGAVGAAITISTVSVGAAANSAIMSTDSNAGADVWFSSDAAGTLPLAAKLVYWSDGDSEFKFKVYFGSVSAVSGATVYLHVGSKPGGISTDPFPATAEVRAPMISDFADITSNGNDGTGAGGVAAGAVTGPDGVLPATTFDGTDDSVAFGDLSSAITVNGTASAWVKTVGVGTIAQSGLWTLGTSTSLTHYPFTNNRLYVVGFTDARQINGLLDTGFDKTAWHHIAITRTASNWTMYRNGVVLATTSGGTFGLPADAKFGESSDTVFYRGDASGFSLDSVARTASEINADYLLDGPNAATYWTVTDVTPGGGRSRLRTRTRGRRRLA